MSVLILLIACSSTSPEIVTSDAQPIQSPFHPDTYSNDQKCTWLVTAPSNKIVIFGLTKLDLASGDFLEIRDGKDNRAGLLNNLTSRSLVFDKMQKSTGRFLLVRFKSNIQDVGIGFRMILSFQNNPAFRKYFYSQNTSSVPANSPLLISLFEY